MISVTVDEDIHEAAPHERLIDLFNRSGVRVPHVCYHPRLGPIQTCDTCLVEVGGKLVRACATQTSDGMVVSTRSSAAKSAQRAAFDRILGNHLLYCTVCDNNNGNCTVHNTTKLLAVEHQRIPFQPKPYAVDHTNPFYRYDPSQCILCGRCVEACQNVQVNETLSIRWEDPHPRVLWDGGAKIGESSCVSCGHCVTVCPCNALMETTMLGHAGFLTSLPKSALEGMIDVVKGVEPEIGYGPILRVSEAEAAMRETRIRRTKTVCTYCGVGCSFDVWTKDRHILKVEPADGPANGISTCVKGKFAWDYVNSPDRLTTPLVRDGDGFRAVTWDEALDPGARRLSEIRTASGPDAIGLTASSKCTNEESYLMQKLARAGIGRHLLDSGLAHTEFLQRWVSGLEAYRKSLEPFTLEVASRVCGLSDETLKQVAHMIAAADRVCILWAMGVTQHVNGSDTSTAISNLLLLTGNYMRPGTGAYPLRGHNNVQGASDHGSMPNVLPGYQSVDDPEVRARFEAAWQVALPTTPGLDNHEMVDAIHQGKLKAMYLFGEEIEDVDANTNYVGGALEKLDFFVVQDIFLSETS